MVSLDLKDAYLQVPMHPESHKFLRFVTCGKIYQFKVLCFGLSTVPQVFTRDFGFSSPIWHSITSLPRRLAHPGLLPRAGCPCSGFSPPALFFAGDSRQLGEVAADSNSTHGISRGPSGLLSLSGLCLPSKE